MFLVTESKVFKQSIAKELLITFANSVQFVDIPPF